MYRVMTLLMVLITALLSYGRSNRACRNVLNPCRLLLWCLPVNTVCKAGLAVPNRGGEVLSYLKIAGIHFNHL